MFKGILIKALNKVIDSLEDDLKAERTKVRERDKLLKDYKEEFVKALIIQRKQNAKIIDLENNLEFVMNNIGDTKIKELYVPDFAVKNV